MLRFKKNIFFILWLLLFLSACREEINNTIAEPEFYSTADDYEELMGETYRIWFYGNQYVYPAMALSTLADENTSWFGNWGLGPFTKEPKGEFLNSSASEYYDVADWPFSSMYDAISSVNAVFSAMNKGIDLGKSPEGNDDNIRAKAFGYFVKGLSYGFLANMFDKGILQNSFSEDAEIKFLTYDELSDVSLSCLNKSIELSDKYNFVIPYQWMPSEQEVNNILLSKLANSYAARIIAGNSRNEEEFQNTDWMKVKEYAGRGIDEDFALIMDREDWTDWYKYFAVLPDWMRVDYRAIGYSDTSGAYSEWSNKDKDERDPFIIKSADKRICTDDPDLPGKYFTYSAPSPFTGYWGSYYWHHRYYEYYENGGIGPTILFASAENDLLLAEAEYQLGNFGTAAELINRTRVNIGEMSPLLGIEEDLFEELKYEMKIETLNTACGIHYFYKRGWGELVQYAPHQFPVPASKLVMYNLEPYSFGGKGGEGTVSSPVTKRIPDLSGVVKFKY